MTHFFHNFIHTLRHYKISSLLNILGMAVAFSAFYLILTQVSRNFNYNKSLEAADRTFIMAISNNYSSDGYSTWLSRPFGEKIVSTSSVVEAGGIINLTNMNQLNFLYKRDGEKVEKIPWKGGAEISDGGREVLGLTLVSGSFEAMNEPDAAAISERLARKHHLEIGDAVTADLPFGRSELHIVAIVEDMPGNTLFSDLDVYISIRDRQQDDWQNWSHFFFVRTDSPAGRDKVVENALSVIKEMSEDNKETFTLVSMEELLYSKQVSLMKSASRSTDISLVVVAILILLIALINFINFFFALVPVRIKSVNTYKVFGMSRGGLVASFVMESVGMVLLSLLLSTLLVTLLAQSSFAGILPSAFDISSNVSIAVLTVVTAILTTAAGSIYPALFITSFQPAMVLKGFSSATTGSSLRTILIGTQFVVSFALIICSSFVKLQHSFLMNHDLGFDREQLITGSFDSEANYMRPANESFENILRSDPRIKDLTWSDGDIIATGRMGWGRKYKEQSIYFQCYPVAYNFLDFMGIEMVRGRDFQRSDEQSEGGAIIFNEEADRKYNIDFDAQLFGHSETPSTIAGICKDFYFKPLQYGNDPFAFYVFGKNSWRSMLPNLYVRTQAGANPFEVIAFIKETILKLDPTCDPDLIQLSTFDNALAQKYQEEQKLSMILTAFTLIAIIISLMGVFGIVLFDTQHRSKEIAVRRVIGAEISDILKMLNQKYIVMVAVCFVVASPISWFIVNSYFSHFANHTALSWWVFVLALAVVLLITTLIVTLRSLSAATSNPVDHLKDE